MDRFKVLLTSKEASQNNSIRKRKINNNNWVQKKAKINKNHGLLYVTRDGLVHPPKIPPTGDKICGNGCRYVGCLLNRRKVELFQEFWNPGDWTIRRSILFQSITKFAPKRRDENENVSRRQATFVYELKDEAGNKKRICKKTLMDMYKISHKIVQNVQKEIKQGISFRADLRGTNVNTRTIPDNISELIRQHINAYPKELSHYGRSKGDPLQEFLSSQLNVRKMFKEFLRVSEDLIDTMRNKEWLYRKLFIESNLKFSKIRSNTCDKCDLFKRLLDDPLLLQEKREEIEFDQFRHHCLAAFAYDNLTDDIERGRAVNTYNVVCIDIEKILKCPILTNKSQYFKTKYQCYNLAMTMPATNRTTMCFWDESTALKGSSEVGSSLLKMIFEKYEILAEDEERTLVLYSDRFPGQNNNKFMVSLMMFLVFGVKRFTEVTWKFLETGHSFMPADRDFALIEKRIKNSKIHVPQDYHDVIRNSRIDPFPFELEVMDRIDFKNLEPLSKLTKLPPSLKTSQVMMIKILQESPNSIITKESHEPGLNWIEHRLDYDLTTRFDDFELETKYLGPQELTEARKKDIKDWIKYLPTEAQEFYRQFIA